MPSQPRSPTASTRRCYSFWDPEACARLFRDHPLQDARGMAASLRAIVESARLRAVLDADGTDAEA